MDFHVSLQGRGDLAARIYRQLLDAILDGRLRPGERLPPTRELARRLEVSRNTVAAAYERLTAEGFLSGHAGAGTFVESEPLDRLHARSAPAGGDVHPRPLWRTLSEEPFGTGVSETQSAGSIAYDFRIGTPDPRLFPLETWRRLVSRELRPSRTLSASYEGATGESALREAIARYFGVSRSLRTAPDDVIVTQGAQQALDLIGRVLIEPGTRVAVEEPGYPPARLLFRSLGADVVSVQVDDEGLDVSALPDDARLVYVTPSHQFPLGTPMSLARRTALLAWAEQHGAVVIEDDYDSEFRFSDRPLEPLQSLDRTGRVIYVGSFSKTLLPMLRVGFLVAPASLRASLRVAKQLTDWHGDPVTQAALARFIDEGLMARHVRKATREYARRRELILAALRDDFADDFAVVPSAAGLHLCVRHLPGTPLAQAIARAERAGVAVESLTKYHATDKVTEGFVIGFGTVPSAQVSGGMARLAEALGLKNAER